MINFNSERSTTEKFVGRMPPVGILYVAEEEDERVGRKYIVIIA